MSLRQRTEAAGVFLGKLQRLGNRVERQVEKAEEDYKADVAGAMQSAGRPAVKIALASLDRENEHEGGLFGAIVDIGNKVPGFDKLDE